MNSSEATVGVFMWRRLQGTERCPHKTRSHKGSLSAGAAADTGLFFWGCCSFAVKVNGDTKVPRTDPHIQPQLLPHAPIISSPVR
ncbi:hypothetical protein GDO81_016774 [Engystomops pustulosus]|uniref:Uncharacterized protein n=1 Tax=Engystomops pustulosus TaxID=76066 RepID=A0AAV7AFN2_ENGPU|nr:hypothetical protein GDO81_016774 [Engystomops pustulosus]